ncbi:hypothetical protein ACIP98_34705 [Streptomyces sp. NPDC088354]|uniref:hypothetical protein n=1 Tax=Streptomyces sp. NPDC088354 TaxID=3365856 RepID=UPI003810BBAF
MPCSRKGRPCPAGDSGEGRDFAARNADDVFSAHGDDFDDAPAFAEASGVGCGWPDDPTTTCACCPARRSSSAPPRTSRRKKKRWIRRRQVTPATALGIAGLVWGIPDGLDDVVDLLVPELQERGVYRTEYAGTTLRSHLGLRPPLTRRPVPGGVATEAERTAGFAPLTDGETAP